MSSQHKPSIDMSAFKQTLSQAEHIIAVAGAGLSAASGIPTFRGAGGFWRRFNAMSLATPEAFANNPARVWQFYHYRREKAREASPNAAHYAIAQLSIAAFRQRVAPNSTFTLITQNVDGLSRRALDEVLARSVPQGTDVPPNVDNGDAHMYEMHGRIFDVQCWSEGCGHIEWDDRSPICATLEGTEALVDAGSVEPVIEEKDLPRCSKCGELARPGVVWFGEVPRYLDEIDALVEEADLCIVVGTSSTVYPAAGYADTVKANGGKVAVFNLERSSGDQDADFLFLGPCEKTLPEALGLAETLPQISEGETRLGSGKAEA